MSFDSEALSELGAAMTRTTPQTIALGVEFVSVAPGVGVLKVPYRADLVGDPRTGVLAGGVITTLLDHACGLAIKAASNDLGAMATLDLRIDYMRSAEPGLAVFARAECYKLTRSIAFVRAIAYDAAPEDPVATAQGAFVLNGATRLTANP